MAKKWYVIHTQTGAEEKVKSAIEKRAESNNMKEAIVQVLIPTEQVSEVKEGKKKITQRKFFPGYVLIKMDLTDESWHLVKNTPKVTGFLGGSGRPSPISEGEAQRILNQVIEGVEHPKPSIMFEIGEQVRVSDGPFATFIGTVEEVDEGKSRLKVAVSIFGRATPVELEYTQVEKV